MQTVEIPGGEAVFRDSPTVGGRMVLRALAAELSAKMQQFLTPEERKRVRDATVKAAAKLGGEQSEEEKREAEEAQTTSFAELLGHRETLLAWQDLVAEGIVQLLKSWTIKRPLPESVEDVKSWEDLDLYDALAEPMSALVWKAAIGPNLTEAPLNDKGEVDRESPTLTSIDSLDRGEAQETLSTSQAQESSSDTAASPTGDSSPE